MPRAPHLWHELVRAADALLTAAPPGTAAAYCEALSSAACEALTLAHRADAPEAAATVLASVESLFERSSSDVGARHALVAGLYGIVQREGDSLGPAWSHALGMLGSSAVSGHPSVIGAGFRVVQSVCSELLEAVPRERLGGVVRVCARFAAQPDAVNVRLTAVGTLWALADFFGRKAAEGGDSKGGPTVGLPDPHMVEVSSAGQEWACLSRTWWR